MSTARWKKRLAAPLSAKMTRVPLEQFLRAYATTERTLDLGASIGPYAEFFPSRVAVDIRRAPRVQIVGDAQQLGIRGGSFGVVLCTEVLEHLKEPQQGIDELHRILQPGGLLLLTTRLIFPLHDAPHDYYRFTKYGLQHLLRRFEILELREEAGTVKTLAILIQRLGFQTETLGWEPLRFFWLALARLVPAGSKLITREFGDSLRQRRETSVMSSGYYVACRKPMDPDPDAAGGTSRA